MLDSGKKVPVILLLVLPILIGLAFLIGSKNLHFSFSSQSYDSLPDKCSTYHLDKAALDCGQLIRQFNNTYHTIAIFDQIVVQGNLYFLDVFTKDESGKWVSARYFLGFDEYGSAWYDLKVPLADTVDLSQGIVSKFRNSQLPVKKYNQLLAGREVFLSIYFEKYQYQDYQKINSVYYYLTD